MVGRHELNALTPQHRAVVDGHRRYYHRRVTDTIAAGVRSGEFVVTDVHVATLALLDMLNGTSGWYHRKGTRSPAELADVYVSLSMDGLLHARTR